MLLKRCQISISLHPKILFFLSFVTPRWFHNICSFFMFFQVIPISPPAASIDLFLISFDLFCAFAPKLFLYSSHQLISHLFASLCFTLLFLWLINFLLRLVCNHMCKLTYVTDKPQPCLPDWSFTLKPILSFFHTLMHWFSPLVTKSPRIPEFFCWLSKVEKCQKQNTIVHDCSRLFMTVPG